MNQDVKPVENRTNCKAQPESGEQSRTAYAVSEIMKYIHLHNLNEGDVLPTGEKLCEMLSISRVSLREAICQLKGMGLIESRQGSGFVVSNCDITHFYDMIMPIYMKKCDNQQEIRELRYAQEVGSIPLVIKRINEQQLDRLTQLCKDMFSLLDHDTFCGLDLVKQDMEFHQILAQATRNRLLESISKHYFEYWLRVLRDEEELVSEHRDDLYNTAFGHQAILTAIRLKNVSLGLLAMHHHYSGFYENM